MTRNGRGHRGKRMRREEGERGRFEVWLKEKGLRG